MNRQRISKSAPVIPSRCTINSKPKSNTRVDFKENEQIFTVKPNPRSSAREKGQESDPNMSDYESSEDSEDEVTGETEHRDKFKRFKKRTLKKILKNFNLEETIARNSRAFAISYFIEEKDFSLECSLQASLLKQRLQFLMGTNEVRINDPLYADTLRERLLQEYEAELDRKEEERAEGERIRMRRLLKEGVISADELKEDPLFLKEYKRQKAKYGRANPRRAKSPTRRRAQTAPPAPEGRTRHHNDIKTSIFPMVGAGYQTRPQTSVRRTDRPKTVQWERRPYIKYKKEEDNDDDPFEGKRRPLSAYRYEHPQIKELREEETVDGLYSLAEEILDGKLPSQKAQPATKKTMP